jgi:hypothetical protein
MADQWIKLRCGLEDEPEVIALAESLECDELDIVGRLHRFWSWAERCSDNGRAARVSARWIDRYCRLDGFAHGLVEVGWLSFDDDGLSIPGFEKHMGQVGRSKALNARRALLSRERHAASATTALIDGESIPSIPSIDGGKLDQEAIRALARRINDVVTVNPDRREEDRKVILQAAMMVLAGHFSEDDLTGVLDRIKRRKPKRTMPYFITSMKNLAKAVNLDWQELSSVTHPPAELVNGNPT